MHAYLSLTVLGVFLPATMLCYQVAPRRARPGVLLAASYLFFWLMSGELTVYLALSTVSIWALGLALDGQIRRRARALKEPGTDRRAVKRAFARRMRAVLAAGVTLNFGVLFAFKYLGFAEEVARALLAALPGGLAGALPMVEPAVAAPIGISFYTLQAISYLVDVYRQSITADRSLARVALFLSFFPAIMEGPICRYGETAQALWAGHPITWPAVACGAERIAWGLAKKLIVADRVNLLVKNVFASPGAYDGGVIALAAVLYTVQLYCDFSGTMDFVVGTGRIFGVRMPENFRQPFFSRTGSEFWQRWHITLGTWFRDYVFYPVSLSKPVKHLTTRVRRVAGNRLGPLVTSGIALLCVWLGNGLWHGAGGQYVLFGLFWFAVIWIGGLMEPVAQAACERMGIDRAGAPYRVMQHARTLAVVFCGELIFRAEGTAAALTMLERLFTGFTLASFRDGTVLALGMDAGDFACVAVACAALLAVGLVRERGRAGTGAVSADVGTAPGAGAPAAGTPTAAAPRGRLARTIGSPALRWAAACTIVLIVVVFGAYGAGYVPVDPMYASF